MRNEPAPTGASAPWSDIASGVVAATSDQHLSFTDALESPCATCSTAPCCTHLPLNTFTVTNVLELDHARYLLNFDHIVLGLSATGDWSTFYTQPCRHLDLDTMGCTVHDTPRQPSICTHYNPYQCWYKRVFTVDTSDEFVQIDRRRLAWILERVELDDNRNIVAVPDWESMVEAFEHLGHEVGFRVRAAPSRDRKLIPVSGACGGCPAPCCQKLVFPIEPPSNIGNLDYYRFALGFNGIELGLTDSSWSMVVTTTCRHLDDGACSIYGEPHRPLLCRYYDALKCTYKGQFAADDPDGFILVDLERCDELLDSFEFDEFGTILSGPTVATLKERLG